ncbi:MAG: rod shape-determining protein MreD [Ardenticatenia bacterium]|nr:MAG: rod shape-determining protein MreD [Ardenticatenia bacterium]
MKWWMPILVMLVAALIQATWLHHFAIGGVHPDLVLLIVVAWSLLRGTREGVILAFLGGFFLDSLSAAPFGVFTIPLLLVAFITGLGEINILRMTFILPLLVGFLATLLYYILAFVMLRTLQWNISITFALQTGGRAALYNTLLMPFVYVLSLRVHRVLERIEQRQY